VRNKSIASKSIPAKAKAKARALKRWCKSISAEAKARALKRWYK